VAETGGTGVSPVFAPSGMGETPMLPDTSGFFLRAEPMRRGMPILGLLIAIVAQAHAAVKIADITRIEGQQENTLSGIGLVVGLQGTGDGGDYLPAIKPLAAMLTAFSNEAQLADLADVKNVALVGLSVKVPKDGVHEGSKLDVRVSSWGKAQSINGGHLVPCPMTGPGKPEEWGMIGTAVGSVVSDDPSTLTGGIIKAGCMINRTIKMDYIVDGKLPLVLDNEIASWTTASAIAQVINDSEANGKEVIAVAVDPTLVEVTVPKAELARPDGFISRVLRLPVPDRLLNAESRVVINDKRKTLVISGDVEISPTVISQKGLTITTVSPKREPTLQNPQITTKEIVALDTSSTGGAKLQDLVAALEQLKVPAEDRITIIKELHKSGKLHAKLVYED
jgi:flagellar P-ring protein precursor FlgI